MVASAKTITLTHMRASLSVTCNNLIDACTTNCPGSSAKQRREGGAGEAFLIKPPQFVNWNEFAKKSSNLSWKSCYILTEQISK